MVKGRRSSDGEGRGDLVNEIAASVFGKMKKERRYQGWRRAGKDVGSREKPKKDGPMSLEEAMDESENLTDFLLDFDNADV
ncbi:hypothetical protein Droror1_Dr00011267 [Drosera rotundifolia]